MFGKNKILKAEIHDGDALDIQEIFPTLQGEGPYAGHPSVFIRLGGCNLACEFCDTEFDSYENFSLTAILAEVQKLAKNSVGEIVRKLIVITGGEPLRQPIEKLCEELVKLDFLVQIETNGTLFRELPPEVKIICSPKITNGKYHAIRPDLLSRINAFKFIVSHRHTERSERHEYSVVPKEILRYTRDGKVIPVYVQPMDEYDEVKNRDNLEHSLQLCEENGYLLSLQIHKILGLK